MNKYVHQEQLDSGRHFPGGRWMVATSKSNDAEVIVVSQGMIVVVSFVKCPLQMGLSKYHAEKNNIDGH